MPPALAVMLEPRVKRLGYLGEFFQCAANQPEALMSFNRFTEALKSALPDNLTETVVLTVAATMSNTYERHQHERLCLKLGFTENWIREVLSLSRAGGGTMKPDEQAVQRLALALLKTQGLHVDSELEDAVQAIGPSQTMAILFLIGRYVTHALIVNALKLPPPVPSPLESSA